ncbi:hypothetical protein AX16_001408 [Volvariella volvacea WC 439]|nr:hypothetical protein AX16_001408 [Volvariella volvacea WC 439]
MSTPIGATQAKDRLYAQLAGTLVRMTRSISYTADLLEQLQVDLDAMRTFAGLDAARFMAVAAEVNDEADYEEDADTTQR